jgi:hypothetical protein
MYVFGNPLKYTDPSGHGYCDSENAVPEDCQDRYKKSHSPWNPGDYGIVFVGKDDYEWTSAQKLYVIFAAMYAGMAFAAVLPGLSPAEAFRAVYGVDAAHPFIFVMGNCDPRERSDGTTYGGCGNAANGDKGGAYTWGLVKLNFMEDNPSR